MNARQRPDGPGGAEDRSQDTPGRTGRPGRLRPLVTASVVGAVLLAGGAVAAGVLGSGDSGGSDSAPAAGSSATPPPLALDGESPAPEGSAPGIAPGEPDPNGVRYRLTKPLPKGPGTAAVHRVSGTVSKEAVARLAKALGVEGTPRTEGESWRIGPANDGSGPSLRVTRQAPGSWTFLRHPGAGGDNCPRGKPCSSSAGGTPVSEEAAVKAAAPVLKAVGQDGARTAADTVRGAERVVEADPVLSGLPTQGWTTRLQVGPDGQLSGGSGRLLTPQKGASYPVDSAKAALDRLNEAATPATSSPAPGTASVEDARFGLSAHYEKGQPVLVPSWLFEVRQPGATEPVTLAEVAVDERYLRADGGQRLQPGGPGSAGAGEETRAVRPQSYASAGRELTVHFTGGVCATYRASAKEKDGQVRVSVVEHREPGKVCVLVAKELSRTVTLESPRGDRTVVDSAGGAVPAT